MIMSSCEVITDVYDENASAWTAGSKSVFTADGVSFTMVCVPGGKTFPAGTDDSGTATVEKPFWIGEAEVTYELWHTVYTWATSNGYTFANTGQAGSSGSGGNQQPVGALSWRDCIVFCNALTEWYNAKNGTGYLCVYKSSGVPLRTADASCDSVVQDETADGFRLLVKNEWRLAARYIDGTRWLYGDHASGDEAGPCYVSGSTGLGGQTLSSVIGNYAVYNSGSLDVKSRLPNALGLYDMSGNMLEWCYTTTSVSSQRYALGGYYTNNTQYLQVDYLASLPGGNSTTSNYAFCGLRIARSFK